MDKNNYIYGRNSIIEALLQNKSRINKILISQNVKNDVKINEIVQLAKKEHVVFQFLPREKFRDFADLPHQGVLAYVSPIEYADLNLFLKKNTDGFVSLIILDGIEDPHNFGAIVRTAVCAGYDGIIIPARRSAQVNATVEKTSAGAINHIPIFQVNSLSSTIDKLKDNNYWIIAADAKGKDNYFDVDYTDMNFAIILGGEETGVSRGNLNKSDFVVKIPMLRNFNSLNVSNACAAIIYETVRQKIKKDCI